MNSGVWSSSLKSRLGNCKPRWAARKAGLLASSSLQIGELDKAASVGGLIFSTATPAKFARPGRGLSDYSYPDSLEVARFRWNHGSRELAHCHKYQGTGPFPLGACPNSDSTWASASDRIIFLPN